jgi:hypothetical protein
MGMTGLESERQSAEKRTLSKTYAPAYATEPNLQVIDQDLAELVSAWRFVPDATKAEVSRLVRAAMAKEGRG